eukprot:1528126-Rhodomonas_salina.1
MPAPARAKSAPVAVSKRAPPDVQQPPASGVSNKQQATSSRDWSDCPRHPVASARATAVAAAAAAAAAAADPRAGPA